MRILLYLTSVAANSFRHRHFVHTVQYVLYVVVGEAARLYVLKVEYVNEMKIIIM